MRRSLILAATAAGLLAGCTDPKAVAIPAETDKLGTIKPQVQKLTPEEQELFAAYMMRRELKGTMFGAMAGTTDAQTIGQAIENQRAFAAAKKKEEEAEKALKAKLKAERDAALAAMRDAVTVTMVSKGLEIERGYGGYERDRLLKVTFGYRNNTDKAISGVKGTIIVNDLFGDPISRFGVSNDQTIKAQGTVTWAGSRSLRSYGSNKDEKLIDLPEDKYKVVWEPEMIVFADGTKLEAPR